MVNKVKLKVAHIGCPYYPYLGGSTKRLSNLANKIACKDDVEQYLITPSLSDSKKVDDKYFKCVLRNRKVNNFGYLKEVNDFIVLNKIEIVVLHNSRVLLNWFLFYKLRVSRIKVLVEIHSFRDDSIFKKAVNYFLYRMSDAIVHLSKSSKDYMAMSYLNNKNHIIYNGINLNEEKIYSNRYNVDKIKLCYLGSFHDWQGVNIISENVLKLGLEFWVINEIYLIGDGPELVNVKNKLTPLIDKGANIFIVGWKGSGYVDEILKSTDFLLAIRPSTVATETVFPLKIVDSVNFNIPLICTNVGGLKEKLDENNAAFFIDKNEQYSLAKFLSNPPSEYDYNKKKNNLSQLTEKLDTWECSADKYVSLFYSIASENKK